MRATWRTCKRSGAAGGVGRLGGGERTKVYRLPICSGQAVARGVRGQAFELSFAMLRRERRASASRWVGVRGERACSLPWRDMALTGIFPH